MTDDSYAAAMEADRSCGADVAQLTESTIALLSANTTTTPTLTLVNSSDGNSLADFQRLRELPPEVEWLANLANENTRAAYQNDVAGFFRFTGVSSSSQLREVTRAHVLAWRTDLVSRGMAPATIRRKLAALSDLFGYLCDRDAVASNPVAGVRRPTEGANEGKTPALSDAQAKQLLESPVTDALKDRRDRAILAVLLFHALRRAEVCNLRVRDLETRRGVVHLVVHGKRGKIRYIPAHPKALGAIHDYLSSAGHGAQSDAPLFQPLRLSGQALSSHAVYRDVVRYHGAKAGLPPHLLRPHALRTTATTNALEHGADIARVQDWLGHSSPATTRLYDRRSARPEESPTFRVDYR